MNRKVSTENTIIGLIVGLIGLLNAILAIRIVYNAFPNAEIGSIILGLITLVVASLWITSAIGYFTVKKWASTLALYMAPVIVAVNITGILGIGGFNIHIGWAALSTVSGVGSIWYISRKELASFFIVSVVEHIFILVIFAILIYAKPVETAEPTEREILVTIEEIKQEEPLIAEIIPQEQAEQEKPPTLPQLKIQDITVTNQSTEIETSAPMLPKTHAQITDTGSDTIMRAPGPEEREQRYQDRTPGLSVDSVPRVSDKPALELGVSDRVKSGRESEVVRAPQYTQEGPSSSDRRIGPSDEVEKPGFVGDITGDIIGRGVVFWPKQPQGYKGTASGSATIKFWVNPAGNVTRAETIKKSGDPRLDRIAEEYVRKIRFEELPENFEQKMQYGEISISFELTRENE
jgi:TonB family protein